MPPALKPGHKMVISDVPCVLVRGDQVPKRYWREYHKFWGNDSGSVSGYMHAVSMNYGGVWKFRDDPPGHVFDRGEFYQCSSDNTGPAEEYAVFVAEAHLEPETNEFGVISP